MLIKRIFTAVILIALVLAAVFYLPSRSFAALSGGFFLVVMWEWAALVGLKPYRWLVPYLAAGALLMLGSLWVNPYLVISISMVWWLIAMGLIFYFPKGNKFYLRQRLFSAMTGWLLIIPCWVAINVIREGQDGIAHLLVLFILVWGADTGAYFAGRAFGHGKLAPEISPGKTVEGLLGGYLVALLGAIIAGFIAADFIFKLPFYFFAVIFTITMSVFGDLFESMIKRIFGVKDSGGILPGHGGLLDRIDSLTAAAPAFAFWLWILELS